MKTCWSCEKEIKEGEEAIEIQFRRVRIIEDYPYTQFEFLPKLVHLGKCLKDALEVIKFYE